MTLIKHRYLEPPLRLLSALDGQDQSLASGQREPQLVSLFLSFFGDVDDVAEVQRQLCVRCALLDVLITLWRGEKGLLIKQKKQNLFLI